MITLRGLRWLREQQKAGRELPDNWLRDSRRYLDLKRRVCSKFGRPWDREQLQEAEQLLHTLLTDMRGVSDGS